MKKTFKSLLGIFLAVFMVASLMAIPSSAAGINKSTITVTKGYQMSLTFSGSSNVTWSTGDKSIATVSSKGKVVGKAPGTTYIYAKAGGKTYKCKVNVVPSKITASNSEVELDAKGDSQIVTLTVKGSHSGLTVGSTNKNVAKASWVKPVEWDGNKIKIKITAQGEGSCRIKVYVKKYPKTCYKYIDVTVGDSLYEEDDPTTSTDNTYILTSSKSVDVGAGNTAPIQVYCTNQSNLGYTVLDSRVATVTAGNTSGNYRDFSIKGVSAGTTTVRFYNKLDTKKYVDVSVKVGGDVKYYEFYTVKPTVTPASSDKIINAVVNSVTYYMVVPANFDEAYTNRLIAEKFNKYEYYKVYDSTPRKLASTDNCKSFNNTNVNYNYGLRYVLIPANCDEVKLNTTIAKYNDQFEYYTIYSEKPSSDTWADVRTWYVNDSNGRATLRYMMVPYYNADETRIQDIIDKDKNTSNTYTYYATYTKYPTINAETDEVITYTKSGAWKYMVVPKKGVDVTQINDAIYNDTGAYEAYVMYSTKPTPDASKGEYVLSAKRGTKYYYVLCTYPQNTTQHDNMWAQLTSRTAMGN